jgi:hypothetical protein
MQRRIAPCSLFRRHRNTAKTWDNKLRRVRQHERLLAEVLPDRRQLTEAQGLRRT